MNLTISPPGPQHEAFMLWAKKQGVKLNGVQPVKITGRGLGVVAERKIEAGEELVKVPAKALLTINSVPAKFRVLHGGVTVHGILASFLAFGGTATSRFRAWKLSWPSLQEFQESMPILWPHTLRESLDCSGNLSNNIDMTEGISGSTFVLPPAVGGKWRKMLEYFGRQNAGLLYRQETKLKADWEIVSIIFPDQTLLEYTYYWLIVNTRSFYYDLLEGPTPESHDDRMVLCPFVDYFNHNDHGCDVTFDEHGYTVTSDRIYDVGEEIYTSYGAHGNDFLLVEYGFTLDVNKWDSLPLDDFFGSHRIREETITRLKHAGYFGYYTLNDQGVCHRTQVAVRTQTLGSYQWKKFVASGETTEEGDELRADSYICTHILRTYYDEADIAIRHLQRTGNDKILPHIRAALIRRWEQIKGLIRSAFRNGINPKTQAYMHDMFEESSLSMD